MSMKFQKGSGDFFALDIGTNAVRVLQLAPAGDEWELVAHGYAPVDRRITSSDAPESRRRLGEVIMTAVGQSGIKTKNVAIGLPSNKTFTTVVDVPQVSDAELRATMKYQIDQYVPMADDAKVDWVLLGPSLHASDQQEVLICSPKTSRRFCAVPSGVQVISVMYGLSLPICSDATSVGLTTLVPVIL